MIIFSRPGRVILALACAIVAAGEGWWITSGALCIVALYNL